MDVDRVEDFPRRLKDGVHAGSDANAPAVAPAAGLDVLRPGQRRVAPDVEAGHDRVEAAPQERHRDAEQEREQLVGVGLAPAVDLLGHVPGVLGGVVAGRLGDDVFEADQHLRVEVLGVARGRVHALVFEVGHGLGQGFVFLPLDP